MTGIHPALLGEAAIWYVVFLFSLTIHEAAHALVAHLGGDHTAYQGGQVTLNPVPHMAREPMGTILLPFLSFFTMGWMMGWASTPFDPVWGRRYPRRQALMSLAGPAGNLTVAFGAWAALRLLLATGVLVAPEQISFSHLVAPPAGTPLESLLTPVALLLSVALGLNVLLGLFNLLPLPPLDGAGVLEGLFPAQAGYFMGLLRSQPMLSLLSLLAAWKLFGFVVGPAFAGLIWMVHPSLIYS